MATYHNKIEVKPDIMMGKPVIKGTRIPLERKGRVFFEPSVYY